MKMRNFVASLAACTVALSAIAVTVSADVAFPMENVNASDSNYTCWFLGTSDDGTQTGIFNDTPEKVTEITGIKWTISCPGASDPAVWFGGAYGLNCDSLGWTTNQWCVNEESATKTVATKVSEDVYEVVWQNEDGSALFASTDTYATAVFQNYGGDVTIDVTLLGVTAGSDDTEATTTTTTAAAAGDATTTTTTAASAGATNTGDAGVGLALAGLAVAGAAAFVTSKRK